MAEVEGVEKLEVAPVEARSCVPSFKISCLQCHQFLMDLATKVGSEARINCKSGECRIYNLLQIIEHEGQVKLLHWLEPKPQNVRF